MMVGVHPTGAATVDDGGALVMVGRLVEDMASLENAVDTDPGSLD